MTELVLNTYILFQVITLNSYKNILIMSLSEDDTLIDWNYYLTRGKESKAITCNLNKERFLSFLDGYNKERCFNINWNIVLDKGFQGKLWWLEYSLKRSLWIDCTDRKEQQMGSEYVIVTIEELNNYANIVPTILRWFKIINSSHNV